MTDFLLGIIWFRVVFLQKSWYNRVAILTEAFRRIEEVMNCKFCNYILTEDMLVCPGCGEAVCTNQASKKRRKAVAAIVCCGILLTGLTGILWYTISGEGRANDIYVKSNYSQSLEKAERAGDRVVAKIGDRKLTNGQLQAYYGMQITDFIANYSYYLNYFGVDFTKPLSEQYIQEDGLTWEQYFLELAISSWYRYQTLILLGNEVGHSATEEIQKQVDEHVDVLAQGAITYGFSNVEEMLQSELGASCSLEEYKGYLQDYLEGLSYFEVIYDSIHPSDDEVKAYFTEHSEEMYSAYSVTMDSGKLVDVRHILFEIKGGTTDESGNKIYTDADWEVCRKQAEDALSKWRAGAASEEYFAELANTLSEDPGSNTNGGLYTYVAPGQMVETFDAWCFDKARQPGDTGLVKSEFGYHVMYYVTGDEGWLRLGKSGLIKELCNKEITKGMEQYPIDINYKAIVLGPMV